MKVYRTEEEKAEQLKAWWEQYGIYLFVGVIVGISSLIGWRYWQNAERNAAEVASADYQNMIAALREDRHADAKKYTELLLNEFNNNIYLQFTKLNLATLALEDKDLSTAEVHLRDVIEQIEDPLFQHTARIRLIRLLIFSNRLEEAEALLAAKREYSVFQASYAELKGDLLAKQKQFGKARNAYNLALTNIKDNNQQEIIQLKISGLGQ